MMILGPRHVTKLGIFNCVFLTQLYNLCKLDDETLDLRSRLEICQKIYTTQFSGERILHTENA